MIKQQRRHIIWLLSSILLMLPVGCADDGGHDGEEQLPESNLQIASFTRAGDLTTTVANAAYSPLRLYLFNDDAAERKDGVFVLTSDNNLWKSNIDVKSGSSYAIYGYAPVNPKVAFSHNTESHQGITMTLSGMDAVTTDDVCVIVGVQQVESKEDAKNIQQGKFAFVGKSGEGANLVNLLMDHVYASAQFFVKVDATYNALRTIKLKRLAVRAAGNYTTANLTVQLQANSTNTSPINSLVWTFPTSSAEKAFIVYEPEEPLQLTATESVAIGITNYVPHNSVVNGLTLVSTYDVYDRKGNLIRKDCEARNELGTVLSGNQRGDRLTIHLTITPTYLYTLSDPDLDSPAVTIN